MHFCARVDFFPAHPPQLLFLINTFGWGWKHAIFKRELEINICARVIIESVIKKKLELPANATFLKREGEGKVRTKNSNQAKSNL